jgi:hypothetical protein
MPECQTQESQIWMCGFVGIRRSPRATREKSLLGMEEERDIYEAMMAGETTRFRELGKTFTEAVAQLNIIHQQPWESYFRWNEIRREVSPPYELGKTIVREIVRLRERTGGEVIRLKIGMNT